MLKILVRPELFIYFAILFFAGAFYILQFYIGSEYEGGILDHYIDFAGPGILWLLLIVYEVFMLRLVVFIVTAYVRKIDPLTFFSREVIRHVWKGTQIFLKRFVLIGVPFMFAFYSFSLAIGSLNVFNKSRLQDEMLARWDIMVTGSFPSFTLASLPYPEWFMAAMDISFSYVVSVFLLFGIYMFQANHKLFREAAAAFFIGIIIMFVGWTLFPAMSPYERFVADKYDLSVPPYMQEYVDQYSPHPVIAAFWENMNAKREGLKFLPTTTFPSAHVVWSILLVYYAYRIRKWSAVFFVPFAMFSTIGTVLLAAHYLVDVPAGIVVSILSIFLARYIIRLQEGYALESA